MLPTEITNAFTDMPHWLYAWLYSGNGYKFYVKQYWDVEVVEARY